MKKTRFCRWLLFLWATFALTGCSKLVLFDSKGPVGIAERNIIIMAFVAMLIVVIPVIIMSVWFAYHYREGNEKAKYDPGFTHSTKIEFFVWGIPIVIIIFLAYLAYRGSHDLDPYKPLASEEKPVTIQAVALNWKWLFIYPEQGIATVNEIYFPKDVPVNFRITSDAPMNSFFIPQLGGQIYAMAGMQTQLHLMAHETGTFRGMSSNYSGAGFAGMHFTAVATEDRNAFDAWVEKVRSEGQSLDDIRYSQLAQDSKFDPVAYFSQVKPGLFQQIMHQYNSKRTMNHAGHVMTSGDEAQMMHNNHMQQF
ncbi:Cytochrome bo(3) ubiquinol oxidase subunit 2 [Saezia sanguinis]|uniref:Ubiquinol oxidase subunit 2 n=1 Tax=Saezia sanguinis TaxID=1965230 RepID=A0A433SEZ5_9BURK|nr:ubiquinol oxidase subunit II [Saezia sanguinis]RUS67292.1 Cytochrome bo(3) ubiquinol oxidase subunit 2 [Saezia sanguinis]